MYLVTVLNKEADVETLGIKQNLNLSWIDGQIGELPVFEFKKDAMRYTNGDDKIIVKIALT